MKLFESLHQGEQLVAANSQQLQVAGVGNTTDLQRLQVYVRVRPAQQDSQPCLQAADQHAVVLLAKPEQQQCDGSRLTNNNPPPHRLLQAGRKSRAQGQAGQKRFGGFTRVFGPETTQEALFEATARQQVWCTQ